MTLHRYCPREYSDRCTQAFAPSMMDAALVIRLIRRKLPPVTRRPHQWRQQRHRLYRGALDIWRQQLPPTP